MRNKCAPNEVGEASVHALLYTSALLGDGIECGRTKLK